MKVKELIEWLKTKNPNDFIGLLDLGQDSGDWIDLQKSNWDNGDLGNLKVLNYENVIKTIKKEHGKKYSKSLLEEFNRKYENE